MTIKSDPSECANLTISDAGSPLRMVRFTGKLWNSSTRNASNCFFTSSIRFSYKSRPIIVAISASGMG